MDVPNDQVQAMPGTLPVVASAALTEGALESDHGIAEIEDEAPAHDAAIEEPYTPTPETERATAAFLSDAESVRDEAPANAADAPQSVSTVCGYRVHPIAELFGWMPEAEYAELVADIRQNGLIHPIIIQEGQIVDGRHRAKACVEAGVEPRFDKWANHNKGQMTLSRWILSVNARRRHLTPEQLAAAHLAVRGWEDAEEARRKQAEGRQHGGEVAGRGRPKVDSLLANSPVSNSPVEEPGPSDAPVDAQTAHSTGRRAELREAYDVSEQQAKHLLSVQKNAPELLPKIAQGEMPARVAAQRARAQRAEKTLHTSQHEATKKPVLVVADRAKNDTAALEKLIAKAVRAVEGVLAKVPDHQQQRFKNEVAATVRKLA